MVAFLASVPWPGCSLIYNRTLKALFRLLGWGGAAETDVIKPTLSLGRADHLPPDKRIPRCRSVRARTHTHGHRCISQMFLVFLHGEEVKMSPLPQQRAGHSSPLILSTPSYSSPGKPLQEVATVVAGRQRRERLGHHQPGAGHAGQGTTFTFQTRQTQRKLSFQTVFTLLKAAF